MQSRVVYNNLAVKSAEREVFFMSNLTITLEGNEVRADFYGANAWLRNDGTSTIYAGKQPDVVSGAVGVVSVPAGGSAPVFDAHGTVYLVGTGSVQLIGSDYSSNPFKTSAQSGGSGADEVARAAIEAHAENSAMHLTAEQLNNAIDEANPVINDYEYVSDTSVRFNGITYNVEKDSETGLISKITDTSNHEFSPTINSGITDVNLHNAVFWASAMLAGFGKIQQRTLYDGLNGSWMFSGGFSGFTKVTNVNQPMSGDSSITYTSGEKVIRLSKSYSLNDYNDNYTDTIVLRSNEQINLTGYKTLRVLATAFKNDSALTGSVYFKWGGASGAVQQEQYDFGEWTNVTSCDTIATDYNAPGTAQWYDIDISDVNGNQYLNFAVYHGTQVSGYTTYFDIQQMILV